MQEERPHSARSADLLRRTRRWLSLGRRADARVVHRAATELFSLRTFIGIELGDALCASLEAGRLKVVKLAPEARWVKADSLHLTLFFLGEIADSTVSEVDRALARVVIGQPPFGIELRGTGSFGPLDAPKVFWAALGGDLTQLRALQARLGEALGALGIAPDYETFEPHVTLARSKNPRGDLSLARCSDVLRATLFGEIDVREVVLFSTSSDAEGLHYRALSRHPLRGPPSR